MEATSSLSQAASPQQNKSRSFESPKEGFCVVDLGLAAHGVSSEALLHHLFWPLGGSRGELVSCDSPQHGASPPLQLSVGSSAVFLRRARNMVGPARSSGSICSSGLCSGTGWGMASAARVSWPTVKDYGGDFGTGLHEWTKKASVSPSRTLLELIWARRCHRNHRYE